MAEKRILQYPEQTTPLTTEDNFYSVKDGGGVGSDVHVKVKNFVTPQNAYDGQDAITTVTSSTKPVQYIDSTSPGTPTDVTLYAESDKSSTEVIKGLSTSSTGIGVIGENSSTGPGLVGKSGTDDGTSTILQGRDSSDNVLMEQKGDGDLAIGHDTPICETHLKSTATNETQLLIENADPATAQGASLSLADKDSSGPFSNQVLGTANTLRLRTNASEAAAIDSNGNIGVGATVGEINSKLHVRGGNQIIQNDSEVAGQTASIGLLVDDSASAGISDVGSLLETERVDNDNAKTLIKSRVSGSLTTDVTFRNTSGYVADFSDSILTPNSNGYGVKDSGGNPRLLLAMDGTSDTILQTDGTTGEVRIKTGTVPTNAITVDSSQRTIIGPPDTFNSTLKVVNDGSLAQFRVENSSDAADEEVNIIMQHGGVSRATIECKRDGLNNTGTLSLQTRINGVFGDRIFISASGSVGIGTTSPSSSYKLDVNGDANFSEVTATKYTQYRAAINPYSGFTYTSCFAYDARDGRIGFRGSISRDTGNFVNGESIGNVPVGYRPDADLEFIVLGNNVQCAVIIESGGDIVYNDSVSNSSLEIHSIGYIQNLTV